MLIEKQIILGLESVQKIETTMHCNHPHKKRENPLTRGTQMNAVRDFSPTRRCKSSLREVWRPNEKRCFKGLLIRYDETRPTAMRSLWQAEALLIETKYLNRINTQLGQLFKKLWVHQTTNARATILLQLPLQQHKVSV
jgi:hypothetical protein